MTKALYPSSTLHKESTISQTNFTKTKSSCSARRYAPTTSHIAIFLPSAADMVKKAMRESLEMVGDVTSSLEYYPRCFRPSAHVRPLSLPSRFSLMRLIALRASLFCSPVRSVALIARKTLLSCSWANSSKSAITAFSPCFLMPYLAVIWLKIYSTTRPYRVLTWELKCSLSECMSSILCWKNWGAVRNNS